MSTASTPSFEMWFQSLNNAAVQSVRFTSQLKKRGDIAVKGVDFGENKTLPAIGLFLAKYVLTGNVSGQQAFTLIGDKSSVAKQLYNAWQDDPAKWAQAVFGLDRSNQHSNLRSLFTVNKKPNGSQFEATVRSN